MHWVRGLLHVVVCGSCSICTRRSPGKIFPTKKVQIPLKNSSTSPNQRCRTLTTCLGSKEDCHQRRSKGTCGGARQHPSPPHAPGLPLPASQQCTLTPSAGGCTQPTANFTCWHHQLGTPTRAHKLRKSSFLASQRCADTSVVSTASCAPPCSGTPSDTVSSHSAS